MATDRDYSVLVARLTWADAEGCCKVPNLCEYHKGYAMGISTAIVHLDTLHAIDPEVEL